MRLTGAAVGGHRRLGRLPSASERLAQCDQGREPRQPVLNELVARLVENALCLEERQQVAGAMLVTQPRALERALALCEALLLEYTRCIEVLQGAERVLDVNQCREDRGPIGGQELALARSGLIAPRPQTPVVEDRLRQVGRHGERWAGAADRDNGGRQRRILHPGGGGER